MTSPRVADLFFARLVTVGERAERPWGTDHASDAVEVVEGTVHPARLAEAAARLGRVVRDRGVAEGDYCVVWLDRPLDVLIAVAGLTAFGAVPVLLSPGLDPAAARAALEPLTETPHLLATRQRAEHFPAGWEGDARRLVWEDVASVPVPDGAPELPPHGVELPADRPYVATHTSGTTGVPKLVLHTRNSFYQQAAAQVRMLRTMRLKGYLAAAISPVHIRTLTGVLAALRLGAPLVLLSSEAPEVVAQHLVRWRPEYLETHPNSFVTWEGLAATDALSSVRVFLGTFDAVHPRTVRAMLSGSRRRRLVFAEVYAQSELGPVAFRLCTRRLGHARGDVRASLAGHRVGRPVPGYARVRVVDDQGNPVRRGTPGRIQVRAKGRFATYLNFPEKFRANISPDGWWDTGDWGTLGRLGGLRLLDRQVERLDGAPSGIALEDILLERVPEVAEAVVLETDDGLQPVVVCQPGTRITDERWAEVTADLPALTAPRFVAWEEIPRTATGKVRREVLRQRLARTPAIEADSAG